MQKILVNTLLAVVIATAAFFRLNRQAMTKKQTTMLDRILMSASLLLVLE